MKTLSPDSVLKMTFTRREWLVSPTLLTTVAWTIPEKSYRYLVAQAEGSTLPLPADYSIPFGWKASPVPGNDLGVTLNWKKYKLNPNDLGRIRITSATDGREECTISVSTASSQTPLDEFDVRYAVYMQPL